MKHIVIVGNGIAGLTAADTLRRHGFNGKLTVIGDEPYATYSRPALSKAALAGGSTVQASFLPERTHEVTEILGRAAAGLDTERRAVLLDDQSEITYDGLVIATGSRARRFTGSSNEYTLRGLDDAVRLQKRLIDQPRVVIIGGGPLGMEVASGAIDRGCEVTLIHPGPPLLSHVGPLLAPILSQAALGRGLELVDDRAEQVQENEQGMVVTLTGGNQLFADLVVSAIGDQPNDDWLRNSGLLIDGRLLADGRCRVRDEIVAAGDVAWLDSSSGPTRAPIWYSAIEQAKTAAAALLDGDVAEPLDYQSYFWTDQWGMNLKISGSVPLDGSAPIVIDGAVSDRSCVVHWPDSRAAAALNRRMPIPRLHRLARSAS